MPARAIPYAVNPVSGFAANPMANEVTLPPLPDALKPMGPPKPAPTSIVSPLPPATGPKSGPGAGPTTTGLSSDGNGGTTINGDAANGTASIDGMDVSDESGHGHPRGQTTVTTNDAGGFLDWVRQNQDSAALARAARARYNQAAPSSSESATDDDLMLNIRYPYLWNQDQPPGGGAVIYSIKR